jgi:hypothetical protein
MAKNTAPEGMKTCSGVKELDIPPHDAPVAEFSPRPSAKDGMYHQCREHAKMYRQTLHAAKVKANEALGIAPKPKRQPKPSAEDPMPADELEEALAAFGGPDTEEGQALLKAEADKAVAARKRTKKAAEAEKKAAAEAKAAEAAAAGGAAE